VISTEEIVDTDSLRLDPARTTIPGFAVDAVVLQPLGAYPHECYGQYLADDEAFRVYMDQVRAGGSAGARVYVEALVAHPDHDSFLASVPPTRLERLITDAKGMMPR
jgi:glutaconate CoA-transferase subunit A